MSTLSERSRSLSKQLTDRDAARRQAEVAGDLEMRNLLALANAEQVRDAPKPELGSLVLAWMLDRTRKTELLSQTRDALRVALAYAAGEFGPVTDDSVDELAGCRQALRLATEALA